VRVDVDRHVEVDLQSLIPFLDQPWRHRIAASPKLGYVLPRDVGDPTVGGRIKRPLPARPGGSPGDDPVGADAYLVFPSRLLAMSLHPDPGLDAAVARAYARWLTEVFLPGSPGARGVLYLPFRDAEECRRLVAQFAERPGVVGVFITAAGFLPLHDNRYVPLYAELQERGLPLCFHPTSLWRERPFELFDRYLPVYALGRPFYQCAQVINWVLHGLPERFPRLPCVFLEAGVSWLSFIAHRLDQEFLKRPSEAPLLRDRPSHYIARYFYGTQPLEQGPHDYLESAMKVVGYDHLLYASNFPEADFDLPGVVERLPFLAEEERAAILGGNALRLFRLGGPGGEHGGASPGRDAAADPGRAVPGGKVQ
jgi:predicted TIM-barrel fold metal-dependent hydrolase